ncbi:endonuclease/exonuclease/phosphatase family protein [Solirubrobacter sp. CPCC 204708]|uniref:Endonuclease/exonuclease/phosphatase family protein n=1 Tax=Solirubrobacter deserti TaxID=2282478 RepID=A0ABT4RP05_9ACTN|nr:endonuclease/exonuclease/phosphatase family protein [Solirubrobacter deserti]MBE2317535.1 endonuclease/exonuclease/phosphatase family protein [Solirubrobacter deserti]MDA0140289.1 endonuclease/exonuclease/phosphatase family protein [Solirubrobacter deserti]
MRTWIAVLSALPWVGWAALRLAGVELPYPLVAAIAFTPYAALTSPLPVVLALILRRKGVAIVAAVAALALGATMVPRAVAGPRPEADGPRLVVMTSNLWLGHANADDVLRTAREHDVDVLAVQELRPKLAARLQARGAKQFPHQILLPHAGAAGSGLLSRRPLGSAGGDLQPEAVLLNGGAPPVRIKSVHPRPPVTRAAEPQWRRALAALPGSDGRGDVRILAGDFNATFDHPEFRALLDRGYIDAADAVGKGWTHTWPSGRATAHRGTLPITIDHILVDRRVRVEQVTVVDIRRSDHRAVIACCACPPRRLRGCRRRARSRRRWSSRCSPCRSR